MWGQAWEQTDRARGQQQGEEWGGGVEKGLWGNGSRRGGAALMAECCLRSTADGSVSELAPWLSPAPSPASASGQLKRS